MERNWNFYLRISLFFTVNCVLSVDHLDIERTCEFGLASLVLECLPVCLPCVAEKYPMLKVCSHPDTKQKFFKLLIYIAIINHSLSIKYTL